MDTIKFNVNAYCVDVFINGKSLVELVDDAESEFNKCIDEKKVSLDLSWFVEELKDFGKPSLLDNMWGGKTLILRCGQCGEPGCRPLVMKITETEDKLIWSDFELRDAKDWRYDLVFKFDKDQYMKEFSKIKDHLKESKKKQD